MAIFRARRTRGTARVRSAVLTLPSRARALLALEWRRMMLDAMYLAIGFGFLAIAGFYVAVCDRL